MFAKSTISTLDTDQELKETLLLEQVQRRTWGRIKQLRVFVGDEGIVVEGLAPTFYIKQLAIQAVRATWPRTRLFIEVEVAPSRASVLETIEIKP